MNKSAVYLMLALCSFLLLGCGDDTKPVVAEQAEAEKVWIPGWKEAQPMNIPRAGAAAVIYNGFIYVLGGVDGRNFLTSTEYAQIQPDGSLGKWRMGPNLPTERGFTSAVVHDGYIYVVGGGNGPNGQHLLRSAERARINADGSLSAWETEGTRTVMPRRCTKLGLINDRIYSFGGYGGVLLDSVEFSPIDEDGHTGDWTIASETMTLPRYVNSVKVVGGRAYVIGGHDEAKGVGITDVEWTAPDDSGDMAGWQRTSPMQTGRYGLASTAKHDRIYALGGLTGLEYLASVEVADVLPEGGLSAWRTTTPLTRPRATFNALSSDKHVYVFGGTNTDGYLRSVEYTSVNEAGELGFWGTVADKQAYENRYREANARKQGQLPNEGVVRQVIHTQMYSYIEVSGPKGQVWLAGPKTELPVNARIRYSKGVYMSNFYSKELQRRFPAVTFVSKIERVR